jgi:hypothetical protein
MKQFLLIILFFTGIAAQAQDSLKVLLGQKIIHNAIVSKGDTPAACNITAKTMKTAFSTVTVYFAMQQRSTVYKNTLQLVGTAADGTEKNIDAALIKGAAVFAAAGVKKMLGTYKTIKLRLVQNPANPRMSIPSRIRDLLLINTK